MERDPLAFVWRTSPVLHLVAFALLLLAFPLGWMGIDLVRVAIDDAISGNAFENAPFASFLRLQIDLPDRVVDEPLVLFRGIGLERVQFVVATLVGLVALAVLAGLFVLLLRQIGSAIETRSVGRLRRTVLDGILSARASAREDARQAAGLAGEELAGSLRLLGGAVLTPVAAAGTILLALLYALSIDWKLMILVLDALVLAALAWPRRLFPERLGAGGGAGPGGK